MIEFENGERVVCPGTYLRRAAPLSSKAGAARAYAVNTAQRRGHAVTDVSSPRTLEQQEYALFGSLELREAAHALAETSATRQGLPRVTDPAVIGRVARLARHPDDD